MLSIGQNITQMLLLQNAIGTILHQIGTEMDPNTVCVISNGFTGTTTQHGQGITINLHVNQFPSLLYDCMMVDNRDIVFVNRIQSAVNCGCSMFAVSLECAMRYIDNSRIIHDGADQRFSKKVLIIVDTKTELSNQGVMAILRHETIMNELPLTLLLQPNIEYEWMDYWAAYPYDSYFKIYNRFFLNNFTYQYDKQVVPTISNLNGLPVTGAFINYPPYTAYYRVPSGTGNANLYKSNQSLSVRLDGLELLVLVELCTKYNCTLTARLDYDEELWGEVYENQTGTGLLGSLVVYDANVTCAAVSLWDNVFVFTQFSEQIQRATVTHIIPKPQPLPYWETPILPFTLYIWIYVIGTFILVAAAMFVIGFVQIKMKSEPGTRNCSEQRTSGLFHSIFTVFSISIFQGVHINIHYVSNVTIFTAILLFALVIGNLYSGGLASVMTITRYEEPIDTLDKLLESKLIWGSTSTAWIFALQQSDLPQHQKYVEKFVAKSITEMGDLTRQRRMAVMLEIMQSGALSYQPYIDKDSSKFYMIQKELMYWQYTIIMASKTWPFMEQLNRIVLMQQESGIRYYWERGSGVRTMDYDIQRNIERNDGKYSETGVPVKLSIQHMLGAIFLLLLGNALGIIVFLIEIVWFWYSSKD